MTADASLTRESFRRLTTITVPRAVAQLPDRIWTDAEWHRIRLGYQAQSMDERWNVFAEGDVVFIHRSWTGHGIYEVSFASVSGGGKRIASAVAESDPRRYRSMGDAYDRLMLELVLGAIVLGESAVELRSELAELTRSPSGSSELAAGVVERSAVGLRSEPQA
ncbi:hypothetical protein [Streptomyces noursei]|uniref:hypothetical protein n=1 Tax=Streptomyces noursei TaxID=1971 RepID=UPI001F0331EA|nr:hypothetical protein [Streptomyces noursei]